MASKRLGRFRQWAGEVISSKDKSNITDEARELEQDVELRKEGLQRLQIASIEYHHQLSKKKVSEALDEPEKLSVRDALGIVMITHGEEIGEESAFGSALVKLGRAHCKVATLQEAYALTFQDTFLRSMEKFVDEVKDYENERKKLESRRLNYDAALTRMEKSKHNKKEKEKDRREAEEELEKAQTRYEESAEDIKARIVAIQENEIDELREVKRFLELELNFAEQYAEVLKDVKENWVDDHMLDKVNFRRPTGPMHNFSHSSVDDDQDSGSAEHTHSRSKSKDRVTAPHKHDDKDKDKDKEASAPASSSRFGSIRSMISRAPPTKTKPSNHRHDSDSDRTASDEETDSDEDEEISDDDGPRPSHSRRSSIRSTKTDTTTKRRSSHGAASAKAPSRPASRTSNRSGKSGKSMKSTKSTKTEGGGGNRKRSDSTGSAVEREREKERKKKSVSGWTSSLRGKKDTFNNLKDSDGDDEDEDDHPERSTSSLSTGFGLGSVLGGKSNKSKSNNSSPIVPGRMLKLPGTGSEKDRRKVVRALQDFTGSVDELSFKAGDEIFVVNEVLEGWWMGELGGVKGLFPTGHVEVVESGSPTSRSKASASNSRRSSLFGGNGAAGGSHAGSLASSVKGPSSDSSNSKPSLLDASLSRNDSSHHRDSTQSDAEDHPFGDHNNVVSPTHTGGFYDTESILSSGAEDSEHERARLVPAVAVDEFDNDDLLLKATAMARQSSAPPTPTPAPTSLSGLMPPLLPRRPSDTGRKMPPPPPPPRRATTSNMMSNGMANAPAHTSEQNGNGYGGIGQKPTPFHSAVTLPDGETGDCRDFVQNQFKATGMCVNCFRMHNLKG